MRDDLKIKDPVEAALMKGPKSPNLEKLKDLMPMPAKKPAEKTAKWPAVDASGLGTESAGPKALGIKIRKSSK